MLIADSEIKLVRNPRQGSKVKESDEKELIIDCKGTVHVLSQKNSPAYELRILDIKINKVIEFYYIKNIRTHEKMRNCYVNGCE